MVDVAEHKEDDAIFETDAKLFAVAAGLLIGTSVGNVTTIYPPCKIVCVFTNVIVYVAFVYATNVDGVTVADTIAPVVAVTMFEYDDLSIV